MAKKQTAIVKYDEVIMNKIYYIRNQKVMLDKDLAELYEVETKVLKQAVKHNIDIFPEHFMFEMTEKELNNCAPEGAKPQTQISPIHYSLLRYLSNSLFSF